MKFVMRTQNMFCLFVATLLPICLFPFATDGFAHSGGEAISAPRRGEINIDGDLVEWEIVRSLAQEITTKTARLVPNCSRGRCRSRHK